MYGDTIIYSLDIDSNQNIVMSGQGSIKHLVDKPIVLMYNYDLDDISWVVYLSNPKVGITDIKFVKFGYDETHFLVCTRTTNAYL